VATQRVGQPVEQRSFPNDPNGHRALIVWLRKAKALVRVSLEATGIYSLDLAFALDAAEGIEVAVLNPKVPSAHRCRSLHNDCSRQSTHRPLVAVPDPQSTNQSICRSLYAVLNWRAMRFPPDGVRNLLIQGEGVGCRVRRGLENLHANVVLAKHYLCDMRHIQPRHPVADLGCK
jgi:hypothetical protein